MSEVKARPEEFTRGKPMPPQGTAGGYDQNWYPIALSRDVKAGEVHGTEFLNGKVIVVRDENGKAQVLSAYCRHLGADLSDADVINGKVVCPFHKWGYDASGQCVETMTGDKPPERAKLFKFPTEESWGVVWAFNGLEPFYESPRPDIAPEDAAFEVEFNHLTNVDHFVPYSNSSDIQHLRAVHKIELDVDPQNVERWPGRIRYSQEMTIPGMPPITQIVNIFGTNCLVFEGVMMGRRVYNMSAGKPLPGNRTLHTMMSATTKSAGGPGEDEMVKAIIAQGIAFGKQLFEEDDMVMRSIHFRQDTLTETDRMLVTFLRYVREFPRTDIACDMIS